ncbi:MAG: xylulokinase [Sphingobacteriaceae bacterium]
MYFLGIDVGTSAVKVTVLNAETRQVVQTAQYPETEAEIIAHQPGWAEQDPEQWWIFTQKAIQKAHVGQKYRPDEIKAIGIAYQMHGLVLVNQDQKVLRNAIIWCDSRAVAIGEKAFQDLGEQYCLNSLLNSPGNFTAAKLAWVKQNEPHIYKQIHKVMLPGDFIAMKLSGEITTSISALSEGIFWDFKKNQLSAEVLNYFGFAQEHFPEIKPVFSEHGRLKADKAQELQLSPHIPITYKSGDQPNNALSLNVTRPGEVAATAGTSGVIYGVSDQLVHDSQSRVNTFAHVNYDPQQIRTGILLCINGTGSLNSWTKKVMGGPLSYSEMNTQAAQVPIGSQGISVLPFGNGAERMLNNKQIGAQIYGLDFNQHSQAHLFRAMQEGIAFAFRYGLDIMRENGMHPAVIKAGKANLFLSQVFAEAFVGATGVPVALSDNNASLGAALGAGIGNRFYSTADEAFSSSCQQQIIEPKNTQQYEDSYQQWKAILQESLNQHQ